MEMFPSKKVKPVGGSNALPVKTQIVTSLRHTDDL